MTSQVFLKNLLAFFYRIKTNPISTNAFVLWHYLLFAFYKTNGEPLNLYDASLKPYTGLKPEAIKIAIDDLVKNKYINYSCQKDDTSTLHHFEFLEITYDYSQN